ncbi:MAG: hypothetical protein F6K30_24795 [Cyanothece sp. SIO2G6]|nr:hypothetical protein [Cyanothece sp. SIO2G6]
MVSIDSRPNRVDFILVDALFNRGMQQTMPIEGTGVQYALRIGKLTPPLPTPRATQILGFQIPGFSENHEPAQTVIKNPGISNRPTPSPFQNPKSKIQNSFSAILKKSTHPIAPMKAAEVLQRYANGEQDFRGANLRGQNFRGQVDN